MCQNMVMDTYKRCPLSAVVATSSSIVIPLVQWLYTYTYFCFDKSFFASLVVQHSIWWICLQVR